MHFNNEYFFDLEQAHVNPNLYTHLTHAHPANVPGKHVLLEAHHPQFAPPDQAQHD